MRMAEDWPEPGPYFGREAIMREFEQLRQTWDADAAEPIGDFIHVGDRVAVRHIWRGVGQGPEAEVELTGVWTVRKRRILAAEYFHDYTEGVETLGLSVPLASTTTVSCTESPWNGPSEKRLTA